MEAPPTITCPACRARYEKYHDAQGRPILHCPIGYATVYLCTDGKEAYFATARSYADLRQLVGRLEAGTCFSVRLIVFLEIAGTGRYLKTENGVQVLSEDETTEGLWLTLQSPEQNGK
jgi:hypothetical protein